MSVSGRHAGIFRARVAYIATAGPPCDVIALQGERASRRKVRQPRTIDGHDAVEPLGGAAVEHQIFAIGAGHHIGDPRLDGAASSAALPISRWTIARRVAAASSRSWKSQLTGRYGGSSTVMAHTGPHALMRRHAQTPGRRFRMGRSVAALPLVGTVAFVLVGQLAGLVVRRFLRRVFSCWDLRMLSGVCGMLMEFRPGRVDVQPAPRPIKHPWRAALQRPPRRMSARKRSFSRTCPQGSSGAASRRVPTSQTRSQRALPLAYVVAARPGPSSLD